MRRKNSKNARVCITVTNTQFCFYGCSRFISEHLVTIWSLVQEDFAQRDTPLI
jgi:predicted Fe-S protein YdhL (DUF1289 family)